MSLRLVDSLEDRIERARSAASQLEALGAEGRAALLCEAARRLQALPTDRVEALSKSSGLRSANVRWGLETTLETVSEDALASIVERARAAAPPGSRARPRGIHAVILSGNVFTAPLRAIFVPLALGCPVVAKASPRDDLFAHLVADVLAEVHPIFADACAVVTFSSEASDLTERLLSRVHSFAAYGSDETNRRLALVAGPGVRFIPHGHGLGLGYVEGDGSDEEVLAFAEDVVAYDQRGCLSPHALMITGDARAFATRLREALAVESFRRPRGALPLEVGAAQVQWRAVAEARGELHEGHDFAISLEDASHPRLSPGYRNVSIVPVADRDSFRSVAGSLGAHLKVVGLGGAAPESLTLPLGCFPRLCPLGQMQRPPLEGSWDGTPPHEGLMAY